MMAIVFLINDRTVINAWLRNRWGARTYKLQIKKDSVYKIVLEYWQGEGKANVALRAGNFKRTDLAAVANKVKDADRDYLCRRVSRHNWKVKKCL
jgi:beta-glucosidase